MQEAGSGGGKRPIDDVESVELGFPSFRRFQEEYLRHLSTDGLFVETDDPLPPSTVVRFRVRLPEDVILLEGTGVVIWVRERADEGGEPRGMAIRFVALGRQSKDLIEKLVRGWEAQGGVAFNLDVSGGIEEHGAPVPPPAPSPPAATEPTRKAPRQQEQIRFTIRGAEDRGRPVPPPAEEPDEALEDEALSRTIPERPIPPPEDRSRQESDPVHGTEATPIPQEEELELDLDLDDAVELDPDRTVAEPLPLPPTQRLPLPDDGDRTETPPAPGPEDAPLEFADRARLNDGARENVFAGAEASPETWEEHVPARSGDTARNDIGPGAAEATSPDRLPSSAAESELLPPVDLGPREPPSWGGSATRRDDSALEPGEALTFSVLAEDADEDEPALMSSDREWAVPDVTVEPRSTRGRRRRWAWMVLVAVLVAAAAGVVVWREALEELIAGWTGGGVEPPAASAGAGDSGLEGDVRAPDLSDVTAVTSPAGAGGTVQTVAGGAVIPEPTPEPTPVPTRPVPSRRASVVTDIDWTAGEGETSVTVTADGEIRPDLVAALPMTDPPRVLLRVRGITEGYPAYSIDAGTPQLAGIRVGHHPEQRPPALYVVLDLADPAVEVGDVRFAGDAVTVTLRRE